MYNGSKHQNVIAYIIGLVTIKLQIGLWSSKCNLSNMVEHPVFHQSIFLEIPSALGFKVITSY